MYLNKEKLAKLQSIYKRIFEVYYLFDMEETPTGRRILIETIEIQRFSYLIENDIDILDSDPPPILCCLS